MKVFTSAAALLLSSIAHTASAGFVTTSGSAFELEGNPFYFLGTNAYWASEITWSKGDLATIFNTMAENDLTVCRTWGFADLNKTGTAPYNIVYQLWEDGKATVNTGDNGLGYFDQVVAAAKAAGVKLVVPFVNNWSDYGGIDVYVRELGGKFHDDFYTDEKIKTAYKNFVKTFVKRYADEETIMAWQLCNECRCAGSGEFKESGSCNSTTLTSWITEMSTYIKTLDSNHLVSSGSEGFMNTDKSIYLYSGPSGVDFDANIAIKSIDYGTYHAYPDSWGVEPAKAESWGVQWIKDHVSSAEKVGKPIVLEEYGMKSLDPKSYLAWSDEVYSGKSNMQYWQFGVKSLKTDDDGYAIFVGDNLFSKAIGPTASKFASLSKSSTSKSTSSATKKKSSKALSSASSDSEQSTGSESDDTENLTASPSESASSGTTSQPSPATDALTETESEDETGSSESALATVPAVAATSTTAQGTKCSVRRI
uniref:mannan endo-1,4-beta-mannosidase n=1 Tax=Hyaloperonospora arabidopsidis (strain Emoy2) TaxID=559515 RepID=M4BU31_HYAAE